MTVFARAGMTVVHGDDAQHLRKDRERLRRTLAQRRPELPLRGRSLASRRATAAGASLASTRRLELDPFSLDVDRRELQLAIDDDDVAPRARLQPAAVRQSEVIGRVS
jgi:hypothetical protein